MDRKQYIEQLVTLGTALTHQPTADGQQRRAYIDRIVAFGCSLSAQGATPAATLPSAGLADFRRLIMSDPHDLLWRIAGATSQRRRSLTPTTRAMLGVLEATPDLLGPLEQARDETAHSKLLAHFLNPRSSGDVGAACLRAFLDVLVNPADEDVAVAFPDKVDLQDAEVRTERHLGKYGRVDISLESANALVFVEVKVGALEGSRQLAGYAKALEELCAARNRQALLVFLTEDPEQAPSIKHAVRHITFRHILKAWLPIAISGRSFEHLYLSLYLKTIAAHLYTLAGADVFDCWPLAMQRRALQFLETEIAST